MMAADRLSALQERVGELLRSKDAHVAFAAGGILGCASAALAAVWLHRRKRARPAAVHGLSLHRTTGLTAVLDLGASWNDQHLAVCALCCRKLQLSQQFFLLWMLTCILLLGQALAKVLAHCPLPDRHCAPLSDAEAALEGRWLGCAFLPRLQLF